MPTVPITVALERGRKRYVKLRQGTEAAAKTTGLKGIRVGVFNVGRNVSFAPVTDVRRRPAAY